MKKIVLLLAGICTSGSLFAQVPEMREKYDYIPPDKCINGEAIYFSSSNISMTGWKSGSIQAFSNETCTSEPSKQMVVYYDDLNSPYQSIMGWHKSLLGDTRWQGYSLVKIENPYRGSRSSFVRLAFQLDGNLVAYQDNNQIVWASDTANIGDSLRVTTDHRIVIYDKSGNPIWDNDGSYVLSKIVYNNQIINSSFLLTRNNIIRTTASEEAKVHGEYGYDLIMQDDGNLVLYTYLSPDFSNNRKALWASNTAGYGKNTTAKFDSSDGGFYVFTNTKDLNTINSENKGTSPYGFKLQPDGNIVIYDKNNKAVWASNTAITDRYKDSALKSNVKSTAKTSQSAKSNFLSGILPW